MQIELIETERLQLRVLTQEVYDYIYKHYKIEEQITFLGLNSIKELATEQEKYTKGLSMFNKDFLCFQLIYKEDQTIIGECGYHTWLKHHFRAEIGYALHKENFKRRGLMSEALPRIINYGFNRMELNRIEAFVSPNNIPSIKLITKMNFIKEGLLKQHYLNKGKMEDSMVYALLKKDFEN